MDNYLIFDVSSSTLLYCGKTDREFFVKKEFGKGRMNKEMPELIKDIRGRINSDTTIIIGTGPGSFTGLKTGVSMFIGLLYSLGIRKVRTVSSLKLFALLCEKKTEYTISISPFNRDEFFFSVFNSSGETVYTDRHTSPPYSELLKVAQNLKNGSFQMVSCTKLEDKVSDEITRIINNIETGSISLRDVELKDTEEVDITKAPLLLNYVAYPANLNLNEGTLYVNNNERKDMKIDNLSVSEINDKLRQLREEHKRFDEMSDSLAQKSYLTPTDEMELNKLRKKKLLKKDMISYYENILEKHNS